MLPSRKPFFLQSGGCFDLKEYMKINLSLHEIFHFRKAFVVFLSHRS